MGNVLIQEEGEESLKGVSKGVNIIHQNQPVSWSETWRLPDVTNKPLMVFSLRPLFVLTDLALP